MRGGEFAVRATLWYCCQAVVCRGYIGHCVFVAVLFFHPFDTSDTSTCVSTTDDLTALTLVAPYVPWLRSLTGTFRVISYALPPLGRDENDLSAPRSPAINRTTRTRLIVLTTLVAIAALFALLVILSLRSLRLCGHRRMNGRNDDESFIIASMNHGDTVDPWKLWRMRDNGVLDAHPSPPCHAPPDMCPTIGPPSRQERCALCWWIPATHRKV